MVIIAKALLLDSFGVSLVSHSPQLQLLSTPFKGGTLSPGRPSAVGYWYGSLGAVAEC